MATCFFRKIVSKQNPIVFDQHQGMAFLFAGKSATPTVITLCYTFGKLPSNGIFCYYCSIGGWLLRLIPSETITSNSDYFAHEKFR